MMAVAVLLVALTGAAIASFIGTAALRSMRGEQVFVGRSRCDHCRVALPFVQTMPLISFVLGRGGCRTCGERIDLAHPIAEAIGASVAVVLWFAVPWPAAGYMAVMAAVLLASALIDARTRRLPNPLTLVVAGDAIFLAFTRGPQAVGVGLASAALAVLPLLALRWAFVRSGKDPGLGLGDVKLIGALALWLGVWTPWMVALAALAGLLTVRLWPPADGRIAFGPMIAVTGWSLGLIGEATGWPS